MKPVRLAPKGYCGCCGAEMVEVDGRPDDYWCEPCRDHVPPPPGWT